MSTSRSRAMRWIAPALLLLTCAMTVGADPDTPPVLDRADRAAIVEDISAALEKTYIFADTAEKMITHIRQQLEGGSYDELTSPMAFCERLTTDLQSISHDLHLRLRYAPPPTRTEADQPSPEEREARVLEQMKRSNFCFDRVERLDGNVGYVKLDCFAPAELAGATAIAALSFLANTEALIFDLRHNGGGSPSMIQLISSHLFAEPTHLNSFYIRETDETKQFWTQAFVDGPRLTEIPVYVLTSGRTFSAAEEFTYNLKNLERATIIGETSGGGAHPVNRHMVEGYDISMSLPFGRAVNPVTKTNWEGTGVEPHQAVASSDALLVAHIDAVKRLEQAADDEAQRRGLSWAREALEPERNPVTLAPEELTEYAGSYGPRQVKVEEGRLLYSRSERPWVRLIPVGNDRFILEGSGSFRFVFERDAQGSVSGLSGHYEDGRTDLSLRDPS